MKPGQRLLAGDEPGCWKDRGPFHRLLASLTSARGHEEGESLNAGRPIAGNDVRIPPRHDAGGIREPMLKRDGVNEETLRPQFLSLPGEEAQGRHECAVCHGRRGGQPAEFEDLLVLGDHAPRVVIDASGVHASPPRVTLGSDHSETIHRHRQGRDHARKLCSRTYCDAELSSGRRRFRCPTRLSIAIGRRHASSGARGFSYIATGSMRPPSMTSCATRASPTAASTATFGPRAISMPKPSPSLWPSPHRR